jgi:hypothetical protein
MRTNLERSREERKKMIHTACNHTSQVVSKLPICHFCFDEAAYEAKTIYGYRASMCSRDFKRVGVPSNEALKLIVIETAPKFSVNSGKRLFNFGQIGLAAAACA